VKSEVCDGSVSGICVPALVNSVPSSAKASMFGVWILV
jgi:hypothetical protein